MSVALAQLSGNQAIIAKMNEMMIRFENAIQRQIDAMDQPFIFARSNGNNLSSNVNADVYIFAGPYVPQGFKGIVRDFNVNFSTVAGTIKIVVLDQSNNILYEITRGISSSASGYGSTVLNEGEKIGVMGQTAGAGTFGVNITGVLKKESP